MRFHGESRKDAYDAIVVGAGVGGLTTAALLARAGRQVLVVERHDRVGGYAHSFRRGRYVFDSAVHLVGGCEPAAYEGGGLVHRLLTTLGVRERCDFARIDPAYAAWYPDTTLYAPSDLEDFERVHAEEFPSEAKGIREFLQECLSIREETRRVSELATPFDVIDTPDRFPTLLRYRRATLGQMLDEHLDSPRLKAMLGTLWPYLGLPPQRVSFLYFATMLMSYVADGAFYCRGSFQNFADALAESIRLDGGEVLLRSSVRRVSVEGGRATGIVLENGQRIRADLVVSNADAIQTIEELAGESNFPRRYLASMKRMRPSVSAFVVYAATSLPLEGSALAHENFVYPTWDHEQSWRGTAAGKPDWLSITVPTLADPGLAPAGEHLLVLTTLLPYEREEGWKLAKDPMAEYMIEMAERRLSGLSQSLRFIEAATPRTLERYTRNSAGAIYGWELSPRQVGLGRLGVRTPIEGLHLVGHWTQPGGGVYGVVSSGVQAAREVLGLRREAELWRTLSAADRK